MGRFGVTSRKEAELERRMADCGLLDAELDEHFIRSGGPGGQKVNRTATCVYLKHMPTGTEVKMQQARSQALNRFYARRRMCELLEAMDTSRKSREQIKREKLQKQKARRRKRSRQKYAGPD